MKLGGGLVVVGRRCPAYEPDGGIALLNPRFARAERRVLHILQQLTVVDAGGIFIGNIPISVIGDDCAPSIVNRRAGSGENHSKDMLGHGRRILPGRDKHPTSVLRPQEVEAFRHAKLDASFWESDGALAIVETLHKALSLGIFVRSRGEQLSEGPRMRD